MTFAIRDFRDTDLASVCKLIHETIEASYTGVYPDRAVEFFKGYHSEERVAERSQAGEILVIDSRGTLLGTGALVGNEILGVFIKPEAQGKGFGKMMMRELEKRAVAKGITEITLSVSLPSRKFYEGLGYELSEERLLDVGQGQRLFYWPAKKILKREGQQ